MELIAGIVFVVLGIFVITRTDTALTGVVMLYGLIAATTGIFDTVLYVKTERYISFAPVIALISGMLSAMAGIMLLVYPSVGKRIITLLLPIWFIAHCTSRLSHLHMIRIAVGSFYYYVMLIVNIPGLALDCVMVVWSGIPLFTVGALIGGCLILAGIDSIVMAVGDIGRQLVETESAINIP